MMWGNAMDEQLDANLNPHLHSKATASGYTVVLHSDVLSGQSATPAPHVSLAARANRQ